MKSLCVMSQDLYWFEADLTNVELLNCSDNNLIELPDLPNIEELVCDHNRLESLPILSLKLKHLDCARNRLTELPQLLPFLELVYLDCSNNNLSHLPTLPDCLTRLSCTNNILLDLPDLPKSLEYLNSTGNKFEELHIDSIMLQQHNSKRKDMGLPMVRNIAYDEEIRNIWKIWQYRLDGDKYKTAKKQIDL